MLYVRCAALLTALVFVPTPEALAQAEHAPAEAVASLDVYPGLEATLFASEPMLTNPTNMDIDAWGRVWVIEAVNYRPHLNPNNPTRDEGDRILILEDTDGDGRADTRKVYYQAPDIDAALGIAVFGDKVIVSAYENVLVFTDTDGDDRPDTKEIMFTGLNPEQHDHSVHAFVFGPDGKLYFNFGNTGGQLRDGLGNLVYDTAGNPVSDDGRPYRQGMAFRLDEDGKNVEVLGHNFRNNYELAVDSYGTVWQSDNDDDGNRGVRINYVMEYGNYGYTDEMTGAGWRTPRPGMHEEIPLRHWHLNDPGVVPNVLQTGAGSPTGIVLYEGDLLPEPFRGQMIHADAGPNVVRAYPVTPDGAGYTAEIVNLVESERDPWFRPSDVAVAPDGSLFIADWYDPGVGGHQMGDLERGRIFRVAPEGMGYTVEGPDLSTPQAAAEALASPNMATRYLAWHALHDAGAGAEPALRAVWEESSRPEMRARALWLLSKLPNGTDYVEEALAEDDPNLRITGLRASRQLDGVDVLPYAEQLVRDPSPHVRREVAIALRHHPAPEAADLWADLATQYDGEDRWYLEALGIAADRQWDRFFDAYLQRVEDPLATAAGRDVVWRARTDAALPLLADLSSDASQPLDARLRYFRAFDFHAPGDQKRAVLAGLLDTPQGRAADARRLILARLDRSDLEALPSLEPLVRQTLDELGPGQEYFALLGRYGLGGYEDALYAMALGDDDETAAPAVRLLAMLDGLDRLTATVQGEGADQAVAAVRALARTGSGEAMAFLKEVLLNEAYPLPVREAAVRGWGSGWEGEPRLLELYESGELDPALDHAAGETLQKAWRPHYREAGEAILAQATRTSAAASSSSSTPKQKPAIQAVSSTQTLPDVAQLVARSGDADAGQLVYQRACASCHLVDGAGIDFGPALSEIGDKLPREALYTSILNPDEGISFGYEGVVIETAGGARLAGYVSSETATELTLRMPGGVDRIVALADVAARTPLEASLMPPGLHRTMSEEELVDLVEYLTTLKK